MRRAGAGEGLAELAYAREPKSAIMEYLIRRCDESGGAMSWSAVATGNFFDYALRKFPNGMGFNVKERTAVLIDSGAEPFTGTTLAGIADSVLGILLHPQETCNKYLRVRSVETTQAEILRAFEDVTGVKWKVEHQNGQELLDRARGKLERGEGATLDLVRVQLFMEGAGRSVLVRRGEGDNELLGVKEEDVTEVVRAVVADVELLRVKEEDVMEAMRAVVADAEAAQAD
ncbi:hypothetical protein BZA05DRAFT_405848 [Tricharina praecox]|uniref:uncharacterized protein n=1 Tax=Tricharina praecox TaxID=43433 RepID=UPI00221EFAC3|nr:uncharacterized protein BZA05DRAFT_405848 [Tricharina praecox]KAI5846911.1 hypothetical protein BZA05DRAFT_405848 [Tricharina praecox]